jgi:transposase
MAALPAAEASAGGVHPLPQRPSPPVQTKLPIASPAELVTCDQTIERCVNRLKQWRGIATRYDKRAVNYRAMVVIASLLIWLDG